MTIYAVYRSPSSSEENNARLVEWVKTVRGRAVAIGDFNYPGIDWENGRSDARGRAFYEACNDNFLEQHVKESTHTSGNRLDLVLCKEDDTIVEVRMDGRLGSSDHEIVWTHIGKKVARRKAGKQYRDYNKANYEEARRKMAEVEWRDAFEGKSLDEIWEMFTGKIAEVIQECVPMRKVCQKNQPKWYCKEIKEIKARDGQIELQETRE